MILDRVIVNLLRQQPFYAHLLNQMRLKEDPGVDIAGYSINGGVLYLHLNSFVFNQLTLDNQTRVIIHELLHVIGRHSSRLLDRQPEVWNIACDVAVNQYIEGIPITQRVKLKTGPDAETLIEREVGGLTLENLVLADGTRVTLPPNGFAEQYYNLLQKHFSSGRAFGSANGAKETEKKGAESGPLCKGEDRHPTWGPDPQSSQSLEDALIQKAVTETLKKCQGTLPGYLQEQVNSILQTKTPWRHLLQVFLAKQVSERRMTTFKRQNKRLPEQGLPGYKRERRLELVLAIDTSGSIREKDLAGFISEIDRIRRCGADITIIECDCRVQRVYPLKGPFRGQFQGRGGTDFRPVWQYLEEKRLRPDVLIYLTDGLGQAPEQSPFPTIWALTPGGELPWMSPPGGVRMVDWGRKIHIEIGC